MTKPTLETVRAALATDPKLLALADAIKAADPTAKPEYVEADGVRFGKRTWGPEFERQAKLRQLLKEKYGSTSWGMVA